MEYLKEFKSFHTEDQKKLFDFIKRYQKTSYVSKNKKKLLNTKNSEVRSSIDNYKTI